jgi:hypothetical protein
MSTYVTWGVFSSCRLRASPTIGTVHLKIRWVASMMLHTLCLTRTFGELPPKRVIMFEHYSYSRTPYAAMIYVVTQHQLCSHDRHAKSLYVVDVESIRSKGSWGVKCCTACQACDRLAYLVAPTFRTRR